jgi:hypothetical protein
MARTPVEGDRATIESKPRGYILSLAAAPAVPALGVVDIIQAIPIANSWFIDRNQFQVQLSTQSGFDYVECALAFQLRRTTGDAATGTVLYTYPATYDGTRTATAGNYVERQTLYPPISTQPLLVAYAPGETGIDGVDYIDLNCHGRQWLRVNAT